MDIDMNKIAQIESSNNPSAYNEKSGARGLTQITSPVLGDWNVYHPEESYTEEHLFDPIINLRIGSWYMNERIPAMLNHYGIEDTLENRLISYNFGIGNLLKKKKLPKETQNYIERYKE